ncbi:MAG: hypothetical protein ACNS63_04960 [Candidatus Nitrospinota bacterium M3_3B_026]
MASLAPEALAQGREPSVGNLFIEAYDNKDEEGMRELVRTRTDEFPPEVQAMVEYAMSSRSIPPEQDFLFNIALIISRMYEEETGDGRLYAAVEQNLGKLIERRKKQSLDPEAVEETKEEITELGDGAWRIRSFDVNPDGSLEVQIDVKEATGGSFTPRIGMDESRKAKEIVKKHLPGVRKGKIVWSSMGIGLKTVFLEK